MKIGIVRHFKVNYKAKNLLNSIEFSNYIENYDKATVIPNDIILDTNLKWHKCYCSDLERAIITAKYLFTEDLDITSLLEEVKMYPLLTSNLKIPLFFWSISSRVAWKFNSKTQIENKNLTIIRAQKFIESINLNSHENILIVSHGFFLLTLIKELNKKGFKGHIPKRMKNGYLYLLEN